MPVNEQVTDSVTQVNTSVVGETPASAAGSLFLATSQALGTSALNAASDSQQGSVVMQTATVQGINSLVSTSVATIGRGAEEILEKDDKK